MHLITLIPDLEPFVEEQEPILKHVCREPIEPDEVEKLYPKTNWWAKFRRWLLRKRILSVDEFYAQTCLKSTTAIRREIKNHLQNYYCMIHPFSPFRNFWDIVMTLTTSAALILVPFNNAFLFNDKMLVIEILFTINCVFLVDIILHFFIGHYDKLMKKVTLDPKVVITNYVLGSFIFDFISAIPFEIIEYLVYGNEHVNWYSSALNHLTLLRLRNLLKLVRRLHKSYHVSFLVRKISKMFTVIICVLHWSTCLVYYVPSMTLKFGKHTVESKKSWILSRNMRTRQTLLQKYILCFNRATISLASSDHYLHVETLEDMIMNLILSITGKMGYIYLLYMFLQLVTAFHSSNTERLKLLQQLQEYMQYKDLPAVMKKRLLEYCNYWYKKNFNRNTKILLQVSEPLRKDLIFYNCTRMLETVDVFKLLPSSAIEKLVGFIKSEIYLSNDVIVQAGTRGDSLYFVDSGTVAVYTSFGKEICHLEDGSYFGEISLVMENEERVANVVAIETCEILKITREIFLQVISIYPNLLSHLQKAAFDKLSSTLPLDEIAKVDHANLNYINISNINRRRID